MEIKEQIEKLKAYRSQHNFSGRCACGQELGLAYNPDLKRVFWNCFMCFPSFERVE